MTLFSDHPSFGFLQLLVFVLNSSAFAWYLILLDRCDHIQSWTNAVFSVPAPIGSDLLLSKIHTAAVLIVKSLKFLKLGF